MELTFVSASLTDKPLIELARLLRLAETFEKTSRTTDGSPYTE